MTDDPETPPTTYCNCCGKETSVKSGGRHIHVDDATPGGQHCVREPKSSWAATANVPQTMAIRRRSPKSSEMRDMVLTACELAGHVVREDMLKEGGFLANLPEELKREVLGAPASLAYLAKQALEHEKEFMALWGKTMPKEITLEAGSDLADILGMANEEDERLVEAEVVEVTQPQPPNEEGDGGAEDGEG